jgi:low temperature requirement protein LtrA
VASVKTTRIIQPDGKVTVIKSSHSFGCGTLFAIVLLVYACGSLPILIAPTVIVLALMVWAKSHQS